MLKFSKKLQKSTFFTISSLTLFSFCFNINFDIKIVNILQNFCNFMYSYGG